MNEHLWNSFFEPPKEPEIDPLFKFGIYFLVILCLLMFLFLIKVLWSY